MRVCVYVRTCVCVCTCVRACVLNDTNHMAVAIHIVTHGLLSFTAQAVHDVVVERTEREKVCGSGCMYVVVVWLCARPCA